MAANLHAWTRHLSSDTIASNPSMHSAASMHTSAFMTRKVFLTLPTVALARLSHMDRMCRYTPRNSSCLPSNSRRGTDTRRCMSIENTSFVKPERCLKIWRDSRSAATLRLSSCKGSSNSMQSCNSRMRYLRCARQTQSSWRLMNTVLNQIESLRFTLA